MPTIESLIPAEVEEVGFWPGSFSDEELKEFFSAKDMSREILARIVGSEKEVKEKYGFEIKYRHIRLEYFSDMKKQGIELPALVIDDRIFCKEDALIAAELIASGVNPSEIRTVDHLKTENLKSTAMSIVRKAESMGIDLKKTFPEFRGLLEVVLSSRRISPTKALEISSLLKKLEDKLLELEKERKTITEMKQRIANLVNKLSAEAKELSGKLEGMGVRVEGLPDLSRILLVEDEGDLKKVEAQVQDLLKTMEVLIKNLDRIKEVVLLREKVLKVCPYLVASLGIPLEEGPLCKAYRSVGLDRGVIRIDQVDELLRLVSVISRYKDVIERIYELQMSGVSPQEFSRKIGLSEMREAFQADDPLVLTSAVMESIKPYLSKLEEFDITKEIKRMLPIWERYIVRTLEKEGSITVDRIKIPDQWKETVLRDMESKGMIKRSGNIITLA